MVVNGTLKDPGELKAPWQSLDMARQSLTAPHSLTQVYAAAGSGSCAGFPPGDNQSPSPPVSQLERDVIHEATQLPKKLSLSFQYRHRRLSLPEQSLTLRMKNLSFMALRFEKWKWRVGSDCPAAAPRNPNAPGAPAQQSDAGLTPAWQ